MVIDDGSVELEKGDELDIYSNETGKKIGEGTFQGVGVSFAVSRKKGKINNGWVVSYFFIDRMKKGKKVSNMFSLDLYTFRLKHQLPKPP